MNNDLISRKAAIDKVFCQPSDAHYPSWYATQLESIPAVKATHFDFLSAYTRLTKPRDNGECGIACGECPLSWHNNGSEQKLTCAMFIRRYPEKAVELLRKWEEENPK